MTWTEKKAEALAEIFGALDAAGIDWLVLRNHEGLPKCNGSKDVDLGLAKSDFGRAHQLIAHAAHAAGFNRELVEDFQYVRCLTYFSEFADEPQSVKVDLLDSFVICGAQILKLSKAASTARRENGIPISSQTDNGLMIWMKPLLMGAGVKPKYIDDILAAAKADPEGFRSQLIQSFSNKWGNMAWKKIEKGNLIATVSMRRPLRRAAWLTAFKQRPLITVRDTALHYASALQRRYRRHPASFISVAGPDGVGKTTFINLFSERLSDLQVKEFDAVTLEHFRPRIFPNIKKLITGQEEKLENFHNPHRAAPAGRISSVLRLSYYWLDYVVGYWARTRRHCVSGRTVIFDRYFYDFIVDPRRSRLTLPLWLTKAFLMFTPEPDLVFFLDADAEQIYSRKKELPLEEIERQLCVYRSLVKKDSVRFVRLDAEKLPEAMVNDALRSVIERSYNTISL